MSVTPFWLNANANSDIRWYSSDCIAVNEASKGHMPCIFLHNFVLRQNIRVGSKSQCIQVLYLKVKYLYLTCLSCLTKVVGWHALDLFSTLFYLTWTCKEKVTWLAFQLPLASKFYNICYLWLRRTPYWLVISPTSNMQGNSKILVQFISVTGNALWIICFLSCHRHFIRRPWLMSIC